MPCPDYRQGDRRWPPASSFPYFRLGWHLPLLLYGGITWADSLFIIASQFVATWLYNSTHRSVFIVMVLHLMQNVSGGIFNPAFSGEMR